MKGQQSRHERNQRFASQNVGDVQGVKKLSREKLTIK